LQRRWRTCLTIAVFAILGLLYLTDGRPSSWQTLVCIGALAAMLLFEKIIGIFDDGSNPDIAEARFDTRNPEDG
jgi:hypothetical protein